MFLSELKNNTSVFIDANIFVYHFSQNSQFNSSCTKFLKQTEEGVFQGITSASVVQEVAHRMMMVEAATLFSEIKTKDIIKYLKKYSENVKKLFIHQEIPAKISSFNIKILSLDFETILKSQQMKKRYGFLSNDALTLQIMEDLKITNLVSNDSDFERVDFIALYKP